MSKRNRNDASRRAAKQENATAPAKPLEPQPFVQTLSGQLTLSALSILAMTLAYAPYGQFYLAWIGLIPWLLAACVCASHRRAFLLGWLTGTAFYVLNMWWLARVTLPGTIALLIYIGIYWGVAAVLFRTLRLLPQYAKAGEAASAIHPVAAVFLAAVIWVALELLRGWLFWGGLPWLYLGHSQTPVLAMCQIADITGHYGVSLWVMLINFLGVLILIRGKVVGMRLAMIAVAAALAGALFYGRWRMDEDATSPGPRVMVVQPNYPQTNSGEKGENYETSLAWHLKTSRRQLATVDSDQSSVDLVAWSETIAPVLDSEYRRLLMAQSDEKYRKEAVVLDKYDRDISELARAHHVAVIVGGVYADGRGASRNSAYFYNHRGRLTDRYDKIHLVPFGEFMPFKESFPPLYRLFNIFNPYPYDYSLTPGQPDAMTVFTLDRSATKFRFVTPICFEDLDSRLVAAMFRPEPGSTGKRADFLVNITNDGWFVGNEKALHFQSAIFRSIENRVPTARSVNTGISGFIDSCGRIGATLDAGTDGVAAEVLRPDRRLTFYTRFGDVFATACLILTCGYVLAVAGQRWIAGRRLADSK